MESKKRMDYIDGTKGLCALFIGLFHFLLSRPEWIGRLRKCEDLSGIPV